LIVPLSAGGTFDIIARLTAEQMSRVLGPARGQREYGGSGRLNRADARRSRESRRLYDCDRQQRHQRRLDRTEPPHKRREDCDYLRGISQDGAVRADACVPIAVMLLKPIADAIWLSLRPRASPIIEFQGEK
jgi:hypothetical protein